MSLCLEKIRLTILISLSLRFCESHEVNLVKSSPFIDLGDTLAERDRQVQYWRTKFEVADLERSMVVAKKSQDIKTLRGCEVWLNSYLKSFCNAMTDIFRELRVECLAPEESTAGYISWMKGVCAQLEGIGQQIDNSLKQECCRAS